MARRDEILTTAQALLSGAAAQLFIVTNSLGTKSAINLGALLKVSTDLVNEVDTHMAKEDGTLPIAASGPESSIIMP